MTDRQTATLLPTPQLTTPTLDLGSLAERLEQQWERDRHSLLDSLDRLERLLGTAPRTATIRRWWREQGQPALVEN